MTTSTDRQREMLTELKALVQHRALQEKELVKVRDQRIEAADNQYQLRSSEMAVRFQRKRSGAESEFLNRLSESRLQFDEQRLALQQEDRNVQDDLKLRLTQSQDAAKKAWRMEREHIGSVHAKQKAKHQQQWAEQDAILEQHRAGLDHIEQSFHQVLKKRNVELPPQPSPSQPPPAESPAAALATFMEKLEATRASIRRLVNLPPARFLEDGWPLLLCLLLAGGAGFLFWQQLTLSVWLAVPAALAVAIIATILICLALKPWMRSASGRLAVTAQQTMVEGRQYFEAAYAEAKAAAASQLLTNDKQREERLLEGDRAFHRKRDEIDTDFKTQRENETQRLIDKKHDIEGRWKDNVKQLSQQYRPTLDQLEDERRREGDRLLAERDQQKADADTQFDRDWAAMVDAWQSGLRRLDQEWETMRDYCRLHCPDWESPAWSNPVASGEHDLAAVRIGQYEVELDSIPKGIPEHPDLTPPYTRQTAPAVLAFPDNPSLLLKSHGSGRDAATAAIQNTMLRMLTGFPPGKVRFTIIDPVGLGQNFSAFMHLADYDERFVTNRIWTESSHIQQRLADLTEHMENVIQKYLRNQFESIQQYNRHAGEVAEPFHILVVANFPANFTEESARRLASIASSGARCGVYTLISVDENAPLPRGFELDDLLSQANVLQWDDEAAGFHWIYDELDRAAVQMDEPPGDERFSELVKMAGEQAKDASRVEVPFEIVAPPNGERWSRDSRSEISVPLGRAGATKLQSLHLGRGTSQHVLISGKTGSGKSTLLHALITNAALYYGPAELELYLIDFKKGVEFKPYASLNLPHARVIAIESEREFGQSVLERLDEELKRRGDLFRQAGVQDLKGYRDAHPEAVMPRVMLIIDEFQEFFVKDDKIAQDASLLLDRLVRQGRAFGIHVLLGSQTLAGAYTLARSTIGQMAVRIALQCSEGDAHLILSEENTAARLLNRPGEAIYNDANGRFEGNNPFQVVWLPDSQREAYLSELTELSDQAPVGLPAPIVFEGNVLAQISDNGPLRDLLCDAAPDSVAAAPRAWLGAAVAIKEPTSLVFRRQSGANLLVVGQHDESAVGVLTAALLGAAAHQPLAEELAPTIHILDGARPDSNEAGYWNRLSKNLPLDMQVVRPRDAVSTIQSISTELDRRIADGDDTAPAIFLVIHNLSRFRDLKKGEDFNFSFSEDSGPAADKQLAAILREGPNFGIHSLVWSDSYNNTIRFLDRQSLRDLEMRVLLQMGANDSANLMDSPAAAQLGARRAILYSDELGESEKFRPYGPPDADWLKWVQQRLTERGADRSPAI